MLRNTIVLCSFSFLLASCAKEEDEKGACFYTPTPRVDLVSWPSGLHIDSTWVVGSAAIPVAFNAIADQSSTPAATKLVSVYIRLLNLDNDSLLYAEDLAPQSFSTSYNDTLSFPGLGAGPTSARLSITANNGCGYSDVAVRRLQIGS